MRNAPNILTHVPNISLRAGNKKGTPKCPRCVANTELMRVGEEKPPRWFISSQSYINSEVPSLNVASIKPPYNCVFSLIDVCWAPVKCSKHCSKQIGFLVVFGAEELIPKKLGWWSSQRREHNIGIVELYRQSQIRRTVTEDRRQGDCTGEGYEVFAEVITQMKTTVLRHPKRSGHCVRSGLRGRRTECWWVTLNDPLQNHRHLFDVYVQLREYMYWRSRTFPTTMDRIPRRMEDGWCWLDWQKGTSGGTNNLRKAPKHSTVNPEVTMIQSGLSICLFLMV